MINDISCFTAYPEEKTGYCYGCCLDDADGVCLAMDNGDCSGKNIIYKADHPKAVVIITKLRLGVDV